MLTVATWNIHSCIGTDGRFEPERVAGVLHRLNAEVIALQEVGWHRRTHPRVNQYDFLEKATDHDLLRGPVRAHDAADFGNALLTRLPVLEWARHDLTIPWHTPRGALEAILDHPDGPLRVINVHLSFVPWEQRMQIQRLARLLAARPAMATIMLGDFNQWRLARLTSRPLRAHLPRQAAAPSYPSARPILRFDRIYLSEGLEAHDVMALAEGAARIASDHLPVRAHLRAACPAPRKLAP